MRQAERRALYAAGLLLWAACGPSPARASEPALTWDECPTSARNTSAAAMDCGWLSTGETLAGAPVRLRVVVLRARPHARDPNPVIFLPGGPGDSAGLDEAGLARWRRWQQQAGWPHDVVLFDPRGTGKSRPRFRCDDAGAAPFRPAPQRDGQSALQNEGQAMRACLQRLGPGVRDGFGPDAQLRDIAALVTALGVARVNLWALSYGTRIAQLFVHRHPERVARLVLDSVVPFDRNELLALPRQIDAALARLQSQCAQPGACASANPRAAVAALLARYARRPARVSLAAYPGLSGSFEITPYRLLTMILLASYGERAPADTVARLERALRGARQALAPLAARRVALDRAPDRSEAVFWSTRCALAGARRDGEWAAILQRTPMIAPYLADANRASACRHWPGARRTLPDANALAPPTLVVAGRDDVVTPARWARVFVAGQPRARGAWIGHAGHVPTLSSACAQRAVRYFLADASAPVAACAADGGRAAQSGR